MTLLVVSEPTAESRAARPNPVATVATSNPNAQRVRRSIRGAGAPAAGSAICSRYARDGSPAGGTGKRPRLPHSPPRKRIDHENDHRGGRQPVTAGHTVRGRSDVAPG